MNRSLMLASEKFFEEGCIGAAQMIFFIDGGDCTNYLFQQLSGEGTLASSFDGAESHLPEAALHSQNGSHGDHKTNQ